MVCKRVLLYGKVQGVSFRFYTHEKATRLGLKGWVRNNEDGSVEMLLCGEPENVENLITWAHSGPPQSQVETVEVSEVKDHFPKESFYIRRGEGV